MNRVVSIVLSALVISTLSAAPASASSSQRHCVERASTAASTHEAMRCFKTFDAAINAATGGKVHLKNASSGRQISQSELAAAGPLTTVVLSVDYHDSNFSGSTLTWYQSVGCGYYQAGSMPSGWNDVVSSVAVYSGCANTLFHDSNFGGSTFRIGVNGSAASLGSFNDQTSSEKWCPVYPCL